MHIGWRARRALTAILGALAWLSLTASAAVALLFLIWLVSVLA